MCIRDSSYIFTCVICSFRLFFFLDFLCYTVFVKLVTSIFCLGCSLTFFVEIILLTVNRLPTLGHEAVICVIVFLSVLLHPSGRNCTVIVEVVLFTINGYNAGSQRTIFCEVNFLSVYLGPTGNQFTIFAEVVSFVIDLLYTSNSNSKFIVVCILYFCLLYTSRCV